MSVVSAWTSQSFGIVQYTYHASEAIWFGVDGLVGKTVVDGGSGLTVTNGKLMYGAAPTIYWNVPSLLGATKDKPEGSQAHLYTSVGVGYMRIGNENEIYGIFGGGMLWESGIHWLGVRVDVKGMFYMLDNTTGSDFNSDFALSLGPSFLF